MIHILPDSILGWFENRDSFHSPIYLVGGSIRDQILGIQSSDFDFIVQSRAIELGRNVADDLRSSFYILDKERGIARVLFREEDRQLTLDFADFRGSSLLDDLRHRDFTINAMAREITNIGTLIDPMNGEDDLASGVIRDCSNDSFQEDEVRCLRAVRFAYQLNFEIEPSTLTRLREAVKQLPSSSIERQRDELFNILSLDKSRIAIQSLLDLGILDYLLPDLIPLVKFPQTRHHAHDAWMHTLAAVEYCRQMLAWILISNEQDLLNPFLRMAIEQLKPYKDFLCTYFNNPISKSRPLGILFLFAALYHDVGKPATRSETGEGIQFIDHELAGAQKAALRARNLGLSNREVVFIESFIRSHMLIHSFVKQKKVDLRDAAYNYYRFSGYAGVADCLFSLADLLATYEETMDPARWEAGVKMSCLLLDMWINHYNDVISPTALLNGDEIMKECNLDKGPLIGKLVCELKHSQAIGKVKTKVEAIALVKSILDTNKGC